MKDNLNNNVQKQRTSRLAVVALSASILAALWLAYLLVKVKYDIWRFSDCASLITLLFQGLSSKNNDLRIITHIIIILGPVFGLIALRQIRLSNVRLSGKRLAVAAVWIGLSLAILCNLITIVFIMGSILLRGLGPG